MAERDEIEELRRENEELKKELERVKEHRELMHKEIKERSEMSRDHDIVMDRAEDHGDYLQLKEQSQNKSKDEKSKDAMEYKDWKHGEREYISGIDEEVQDKAFEHIKQQQEQRKQQQQTKEQERSHGRER